MNDKTVNVYVHSFTFSIEITEIFLHKYIEFMEKRHNEIGNNPMVKPDRLFLHFTFNDGDQSYRMTVITGVKDNNLVSQCPYSNFSGTYNALVLKDYVNSIGLYKKLNEMMELSREDHLL